MSDSDPQVKIQRGPGHGSVSPNCLESGPAHRDRRVNERGGPLESRSYLAVIERIPNLMERLAITGDEPNRAPDHRHSRRVPQERRLDGEPLRERDVICVNDCDEIRSCACTTGVQRRNLPLVGLSNKGDP
jgi:hypothetical protein